MQRGRHLRFPSTTVRFSSRTGTLHWYLSVVYQKLSHALFPPCLNRCNPSSSSLSACQVSSTRLFLRTEAGLYPFSRHAPGLFFCRTFRIASLVLSYWSCSATDTTYSSVHFKLIPTVPLQLPPIGRSAYSQPPAASHYLVYKLHFNSIHVEQSFHSRFRSF